MKRAAAVAALFLLVAARSFAAEPSTGTGGGNAPLRMEKLEVYGNAPLRMEELEVYGNAPLRMEELEVLGFQEKPEVLYTPVHRGIALPSPVRYDLFLDDMERPIVPGPNGAVRE